MGRRASAFAVSAIRASIAAESGVWRSASARSAAATRDTAAASGWGGAPGLSAGLGLPGESGFRIGPPHRFIHWSLTEQADKLRGAARRLALYGTHGDVEEGRSLPLRQPESVPQHHAGPP